MRWKIAQAKQSLSEVVRRAAREPQWIDSRERPVAAILSAAEFERYLLWKKNEDRPTMAAALDELREIIDADSYALEVPAREDRPNAMLPPPKAKRASRGG